MSAKLLRFPGLEPIDTESLPPPVEPVGFEAVVGAGRLVIAGHPPTLTTDARLTAGAGRVEFGSGAKVATTARSSDSHPPGQHSAPPVAELPTKADIPPMADPVSRDEMNARLEAVESRLDGKIAQIGADVRVVGGKVDALVTHMSEFRTEVRSDVRNLKGLIIGSAIAVAGLTVGVGAYVLTAAGNNMSSLQTGVAIGQALNPPK